MYFQQLQTGFAGSVCFGRCPSVNVCLKQVPADVFHSLLIISQLHMCNCKSTSFTNHTVHLFHIPQYTIQNRNLYISVLNCVPWDMGQEQCGVCEIGLFDYANIVVFTTIIYNLESMHVQTDPDKYY